MRQIKLSKPKVCIRTRVIAENPNDQLNHFPVINISQETAIVNGVLIAICNENCHSVGPKCGFYAEELQEHSFLYPEDSFTKFLASKRSFHFVVMLRNFVYHRRAVPYLYRSAGTLKTWKLSQ